MAALQVMGNPEFIIGSYNSTTKVITPKTLTAAYTGTGACVSSELFARNIYTIALDIFYTMGSGETSNSIEFIIETSIDGTNWTRIVNDSSSAGTSTVTQRESTFVGADGALASIHVPLNNITAEKIRVSVKETGKATNFGTVAVALTKFQEV